MRFSLKKQFINLFIFIFYLIILLTILFAIPISRNVIAKSLTSIYLGSFGVEFTCDKFYISANKIRLANLRIKYFKEDFRSSNIEMTYDLLRFITHRKTNFNITSDSIEVNDGIKFSYKAVGTYNNRIKKLQISQSGKSHFIQKNTTGIRDVGFLSETILSKTNLHVPNAHIEIDDGFADLTLNMDFAEYKIHKLDIASSLQNLSLKIYEILLNKNNPVAEFLDYSISSGKVRSGDVKVNLSLNEDQILSFSQIKIIDLITPETVKANFLVENVKYKYAESAPITSVDLLPIQLSGRNITIDLKDAQIAGNIVQNGSVTFDYLQDNIDYIIKGNLKGDIKGLLLFAEEGVLDSLKKHNINLSTIAGEVHSSVLIKVPSSIGSQIDFDIKSRATGVHLNIFNNYTKLQDFNLQGIFNGNKIEIKGIGRVNNFKGDLDLYINLFENNDTSCHLVSNIELGKNDKNDLPIEILGGSATLKIDYKLDRNMKSNFTINSNLTNLDFCLDYISLNKKLGKKAIFTLNNINTESKTDEYVFKLSGEDHLLISGKVLNSPSSQTTLFERVKYHNSNFQAEIFTDNKNTLIKLQGELIDLSQADFGKFFKRQNQSQSNLNLKMGLDKVKMKNNISLTGLMTDIEYKNSNIISAKLFSTIDSQDFVTLESVPDTKEYQIHTNAVGKLFALLGISNKVKSGTFKSSIKPSKGGADGKSTYEGKFEMGQVVTRNNKFIAKVVSFISIPGLISAISHNDIPFSAISGNIFIDWDSGDINLRKITAKGGYFDFYADMGIQTHNGSIKVKGGVVPSLYGINTIVGSLPVLKYLFGNRGGVVVTPFYYNDKF